MRQTFMRDVVRLQSWFFARPRETSECLLSRPCRRYTSALLELWCWSPVCWWPIRITSMKGVVFKHVFCIVTAQQSLLPTKQCIFCSWRCIRLTHLTLFTVSGLCPTIHWCLTVTALETKVSFSYDSDVDRKCCARRLWVETFTGKQRILCIR